MKREIALILALSFLLQVATGIVELDNISGPDANLFKDEECGREISPRVLTKNGGPLVAQWHFDEGTGTDVWDSSGNGNDGTLENMKCDDWVDGRRKTGLEFDGENDYVGVSHSDNLNFTNGLTIEAWIKPKNLKQDQHMGICNKLEVFGLNLHKKNCVS